MPGISKYTRDPSVVCPYYRKETAIEIKCKGLCGSHSINVYSSGDQKKDFKDDFCKGLYWNCPLYIALEADDYEVEGHL